MRSYPVKHLSPSSISLYFSDKAAWERRYIHKVYEPSNHYMIFGTAFHKVIEQRLHDMIPADPQVYIKAFADAYIAEVTKNSPSSALKDSGGEVIWNPQEPFVKDYLNGLQLMQGSQIIEFLGRLRPFRDSYGPMVERKIAVDVPGIPVPVIGYVDFVREDGVICDCKTSGRFWSVGKVMGEIAPMVYLEGIRQMRGLQLPAGADERFIHYVIVKSDPYHVQELESVWSRQQTEALFDRVRDMWAEITA